MSGDYRLADGSYSSEYSVGDKFKIVKGDEVEIGVVTLINDDNSNCPFFKSDYAGEFQWWGDLIPFYEDRTSEVVGLKKEIASLKKTIEKLESEKNSYSLYSLVMNQTDWYNGHGQLTISEVTMEELGELLQELSDDYEGVNDVFTVDMYYDKDENSWSGTVYNYDEGDNGRRKMWVSFDKIIVGNNDNE